jgi:hypothetical protein
MPQKWREAELPLFAEAMRVNRAMKLVAAEARGCTRCPLYKNATQTVFGEGPADASLMLIGEQPGDQEDLTGRPPARCSTARSRLPASLATTSTSPMR